MKIKIRPDDASMLQMNDWLAELRDDGCAEPPGDGGEVRPAATTRPAAPAEALPAAPLPRRARCARRPGWPLSRRARAAPRPPGYGAGCDR